MKPLSISLALNLMLTTFSEWTPAQSIQSGELDQYFKVTEALFHDNFANAKAAAQKMLSDHGGGILGYPARKVAATGNILDTGEAFKELSAAEIELASGNKTYTLMNCPMVKGGGDWLSGDGNVHNRYYGSKMPHCGGPKQ